MTVYPHLSILTTALTTMLSRWTGIEVPVMAYASMEQITLQGTPSVFLIPEDAQALETIANVRALTSLRFSQEWLILTVLRDAGDQKVTSPLITQLGEWQAQIINLLMTDVLTTGGPIKILEVPKAESLEGGAIAGKIRIRTQFVFNAE
jgi:hypothetical protein